MGYTPAPFEIPMPDPEAREAFHGVAVARPDPAAAAERREYDAAMTRMEAMHRNTSQPQHHPDLPMTTPWTPHHLEDWEREHLARMRAHEAEMRATRAPSAPPGQSEHSDHVRGEMASAMAAARTRMGM